MRLPARLIVIRRGDGDTFKRVLAAPDRWPAGTAVMFDRRGRERRVLLRHVPLERRRHQRRAEPDAAWHAQGLTVAETMGIPVQAVLLDTPIGEPDPGSSEVTRSVMPTARPSYLVVVPRDKTHAFHALQGHFAALAELVQVIRDRRAGGVPSSQPDTTPERRRALGPTPDVLLVSQETGAGQAYAVPVPGELLSSLRQVNERLAQAVATMREAVERAERISQPLTSPGKREA
jgi:hypothetical protein